MNLIGTIIWKSLMSPPFNQSHFNFTTQFFFPRWGSRNHFLSKSHGWAKKKECKPPNTIDKNTHNIHNNAAFKSMKITSLRSFSEHHTLLSMKKSSSRNSFSPSYIKVSLLVAIASTGKMAHCATMKRTFPCRLSHKSLLAKQFFIAFAAQLIATTKPQHPLF